jgi:hypothetical protein
MSTFLNSGMLNRLRIFENIAGVLLSVLLAIATYAGQSPLSVSPLPGGEDVITDQNKEMTQFFKAKEELFKQDWAGAKVGLEQYLKDFPSGRLADEALYWIAQCSNRLSRAETESDRMMDFLENAVRRVNDLIDRYPQSLWAADAIALRENAAWHLLTFGRPEYKLYVDPEKLIKTEQARANILETYIGHVTKEAAFPILIGVSRSDPDPAVRGQAFAILSRDYRMDALPFLQAASANDPDEKVRREAASLIQRVRMSMIPVSLNCFAFLVRLSAGIDQAKFALDKPYVFVLPHCNPDDESLRESISKILPLEDLKTNPLVTQKRGLEYFSASILSPPLFGFSNVVNPDLRKEPERISGMFGRIDPKTKQVIKEPFSVDAERDQLIIINRGGFLEVVLLQFEAAPSEAINPLRNLKIKPTTSPLEIPSIAETEILNSNVRSLGSKWRPEQLRSSYLFDLGPARAEIPGSGGTWVLEGMLLCDRKARQFIGRQFTLTDPKGKVIAKGAYIEVPADNPQSYRTSTGEVKSKTAVILSPELIKLAERRTFDDGKLLEFKVGDALSDALTREVMKYDGTASIRESEPVSGEFDRICKFSIDKARSGLKRLGDAYIGGINKNDVGSTEFGDLAASQNRTTIPQRYTLAIQLDVLDGRTMKPIRSERIEGYGVYNQRRATTSLGGAASPLTGNGADFEAKKLKKACDDAIAQVTASLAKALSRL